MTSRYRNVLDALALKAKAPLPSLVLSFAILHEATAIVPLVGIFYGARSLGVGERIVNYAVRESEDIHPTTAREDVSVGTEAWLKAKCRQWIEEGDRWAGRVGRRYGIFGFEKGAPVEDTASFNGGKLAGDVANAVLAYGATKALLPLRVGLSLYFSPAFSRGVVEPIRKSVIGAFRRGPP